ncbi:protein of unknown function DUF1212 [Denitrovibrio acetiphilus DSM 12809]|uniref:Threonine/serine exporter-like N-terminal domain-containing protein n=1 Tax=Denitrovibrio acetiphilus (strain DSM 12809 / NBRC 114555 / N2460) TaxID=522772 RepID=D4H2A0_DENA2|nr:threonine/serine exporter family protein [Denitrovibrio acetiphilus]ADD68891.1 protein of unknown function DUF1212 [Denitrovibrio acetiphilus DSM 12809]
MNDIKTEIDNELHDVLRSCVKVGRNLLEYGAESVLIRGFVERTGKLYGMDHTEISLSSSSMVITAMKGDDWITITVRCPDRGIDMSRVMEVERAIVLAESGKISLRELETLIDNPGTPSYNRWLVVFIVGLSCGCFSKLAGGDFVIFGITSTASVLGMIILQEFKKRLFNPVVSYFCSAFMCTCISAMSIKYNLGNEPAVAVFSSVLMLVPGFPLVNALSDILKGFKNMGVARWVAASLITLSTALGMVFSMSIMGV